MHGTRVVLFNARYQSGTSLSYGDCIEGRWSTLRQYASITSAQGDLRRQTPLEMKVGYP